MKRAQTLEALKSTPLTTVFSSAQGGPGCDDWAPELHRINGVWHVYYTANTAGTINQQRIVRHREQREQSHGGRVGQPRQSL